MRGAGLLGLSWVVIDYLSNRGPSTTQWVVFAVCAAVILADGVRVKRIPR